ncbi:MAG TPA: acyltransferase family protein [Acidimicrobiia bacterium]
MSAAPPTTSRRVPGHASPRLGYLPALDGVRAVAVAAVLLYHSYDLQGFRGGFLGVDVFFVLSGYLITCVLVAGYRSEGRIRLGNFWLRRARRLFPALFLVLGVTCAYTAVFLPDEAARLRTDALAALGYVTNWHLIFGSQSYFDTIGRPSLVQHMWSLAVEEQFYLVWPLVLTAGFAVFRRHRRRLALGVLAGALGSAVLMAALYDPTADPSRVFYGTDTHASGLLIGAALAFVWPSWRLSTRTGRRAPFLLDVAGLGGLAALVWCFRNVSEFDTGLYRGGFFAFGLVAAVVVGVAAHPAARLTGRVLGNAPMRWIGIRSYGIYLWHWPVYQVTRPELDVPLRGYALFAVRVAITVTLAALSYRLVEAPIRDGALGRWLESLRRTPPAQRKALVRRVRVVTLAGVAAVSVLGISLAAAEPAAGPAGFSTEAMSIKVTTTTVPETTTTTTTASAAETAPETTAAPTTTTTAPPEPVAAPVTRITALGDSVMLGSEPALRAAFGGLLQLDAAVSRQFGSAIDVAGLLNAAGQLGERVVVHLGTNGIIRPEQFDALMQQLAGVPRVVVLNTNVPRPWEGPVNELLATAVPTYPNAVYVDWKAISQPHAEWFIGDGVHLTPEGQAAYAQVIAQHL